MAIVFRLNENNLKKIIYIGRISVAKGLVYDKIVLEIVSKALSIREKGVNAMSEKT